MKQRNNKGARPSTALIHSVKEIVNYIDKRLTSFEKWLEKKAEVWL